MSQLNCQKKKKRQREDFERNQKNRSNLTYRGAKDDNYIGIFFENHASKDRME